MYNKYINNKWRHFKKDINYLIIFLPCFVYLIIFKYVPLAGILVAFQNYSLRKGIFASDWVGLKHFKIFFNSPDILILLRNTLFLGFFLLITFPIPVIFAILLNEIRKNSFKRSVQTISYLPFFLSLVVVCGMIWNLLSPDDGAVNNILGMLGIEPIYFMSKTEWFRPVYVLSNIWQYTGYSSIIFIAAISGVPQDLYDAAEIDGCNRFGKIWHVTLPGIALTVAIMFILSVGTLISFGFEKALLLQTPATYEVSDVIGTFVYRRGLRELKYSFAAAAGFFESSVSFLLIISANYISKKVAGLGIW